MEEDGGDHCQIAGGMCGNGGKERAGAKTAEREDRADAGQQNHRKRGRDNAEMEARGVAPYAMDMKVDQAEGERVDYSGEDGVPAKREGLLNEAAEENLFAHGSEDGGWQRNDGKESAARNYGPELVDLEAVPDAQVPIVWRVAIEIHANGKDS